MKVYNTSEKSRLTSHFFKFEKYFIEKLNQTEHYDKKQYLEMYETYCQNVVSMGYFPFKEKEFINECLITDENHIACGHIFTHLGIGTNMSYQERISYYQLFEAYENE